jgi:hypothetical protein
MPIPEDALSALIPHLRLIGGYTGSRVSRSFLDAPPNRRIQSRIPNDIEYDIRPAVGTRKSLLFSYHFVGMGFIGTIFGVVHCLAWNFYLPSQLVHNGLGTVVYCQLRAVSGTAPGGPPKLFWFSQFVKVVLFFTYVLAGLALLVLPFRSLYFLTVGAFVATPAKDLLHMQ